MPGAFDPATFMHMEFNEANSTEMIPIPVADYIGVIDNWELKEWTSRDGADSGLKLLMRVALDDPALKELLGRDKITVRYEIMLDTTATGLDFAKGRNVQLGRLREATGLNVPGKPFAFSMLQGQVAKFKVSQRPDKENAGIIYNDVKGVTKA